MDFTRTGEQTALADSIRRFCANRYSFDAFRQDGRRGSDTRCWQDFAGLGWLGAGLSEAEGGFGGGPVEAAILAEEFGRALVIEPYLSTAILSVRTLLALEAGQGVGDLVAAAVGGDSTLALACFEPDGRGDPDFVAARAVPGPGGFSLSGRKSLVLGGPNAQVLLVMARTAGEDRDGEGVTLFRLAPDHPGLRRRDYRLLDRRFASDILLDGVVVGADAVLGRAGGALPAVRLGLDHAIAAACADSVGAMDAALWMTRDYLRTRRQFGQPLSGFQALQHRMADMLVELELARSMLFQAIHALSLDPVARAQGVSAAHVAVAKAGLFVGQQAIQLHGGIGMTEEYAVGHYYKRLFVNASLFGDIAHHTGRFTQSEPDGLPSAG